MYVMRVKVTVEFFFNFVIIFLYIVKLVRFYSFSVASFTTMIFTCSRLDTFMKPSYIIQSRNTPC